MARNQHLVIFLRIPKTVFPELNILFSVYEFIYLQFTQYIVDKKIIFLEHVDATTLFQKLRSETRECIHSQGRVFHT